MLKDILVIDDNHDIRFLFSNILKEKNYNVYSSDLIDRGYGDTGIDFLKNYRKTDRSEEHTSELQSQSTISYAVFCLKKKKEH